MALSHAYRIGIDARFFRAETGGIGRYTRELLHALARIDTHNHYIVFITPLDVPEWDIQQENFEVRVVSAKHYTFAEQTSFLTTLLKERLDLVHFLNYNYPVLYTKPFVSSLLDLTVYLFPSGKKQTALLKRQVFIRVMGRALKKARRVITISENTAQDAATYFRVPQTKMEVIHLGAPTSEGLQFGSKAQVQDYLGTQDPYFLFVSAWRPHKGLTTLIQAFNIFKQQTGLPHKLVLLGSQKTADQDIREAIASSPYVSDIVTPGFVPDELLSATYYYAEAFVCPSYYEGFGLPILEAFNYGAPVIASDNSSIPEVAGSAVLYFPTRDAEALAARMQELAGNVDLQTQLREKGKKQLAKFSWEKCARQTLDVYRSVLEKRR